MTNRLIALLLIFTCASQAHAQDNLAHSAEAQASAEMKRIEQSSSRLGEIPGKIFAMTVAFAEGLRADQRATQLYCQEQQLLARSKALEEALSQAPENSKKANKLGKEYNDLLPKILLKERELAAAFGMSERVLNVLIDDVAYDQGRPMLAGDPRLKEARNLLSALPPQLCVKHGL